MEQLYGALQIVRFCFVYLVVLATVDRGRAPKKHLPMGKTDRDKRSKTQGALRYVDVVMTNEQHL